MLDLEYRETNIHERALKLHARLSRFHIGGVMVILLNPRHGLDLNRLGIPTGVDGNQCKVLITTVFNEVCRQMATQKTVKLDSLTDDEAWDLLRETAGKCVENTDIYPIAKEVSFECPNTPLSILILGKALKDKGKYVWEYANRRLKMCGKGYESIVAIYVIYYLLDIREAKILLMLCCLSPMGANLPVEELARFCLGLQLLEDVKDFEEATKRVLDLISYLQSHFLLCHDDKEKMVKMHDVVNSACKGLEFPTPDLFGQREAFYWYSSNLSA